MVLIETKQPLNGLTYRTSWTRKVTQFWALRRQAESEIDRIIVNYTLFI